MIPSRSFIQILFILFCTIGLISCTIRKPNVAELREEHALLDLQLLTCIQDPLIPVPLTLDDIIEIALDYNLDVYAQRYEKEAQERVSYAEHLRMLPTLTADVFYSVRSQNTAAFSKLVGVPDNIPQPDQRFPQISSLKTTFQDDIRWTINLIDMGLAYFRAKEEKHRVLILEQQHLRARQKLILDITDSYWNAITAKKTLDEMSKIIALSEDFQMTLSRQIGRRTISELEGLQITSRLLDQQSQLEALRYVYQTSKMQLTALMGLLPTTEFELADVDLFAEPIELRDIRRAEEDALLLRPELSQKDLEEQVAVERVRQSIIPMLPNSSIFQDWNYDGNPFLVHNYWWSIGMRVTWSLLQIPQLFQQKESVEAQKQFAIASRLALSIGIMAQVNLAYINYRDAFNQYQTARKSYEVRSRLAEIARKVRQAGEFHGIDVLNFETDALLGKINALRIFSSLKIAEEQLNYAIGRPLTYNKQPREIIVERETPKWKSCNQCD